MLASASLHEWGSPGGGTAVSQRTDSVHPWNTPSTWVGAGAFYLQLTDALCFSVLFCLFVFSRKGIKIFGKLIQFKKNWQLLRHGKVQYRANCSGLSLIGFQFVLQAYVLGDSLVQGDTQYLPKRQPYCSLDVLQMWRPRMWRLSADRSACKFTPLETPPGSESVSR